MEGRGGVRPSLDFQMIFAFNAMVYFDFFQNTWETRHAFWQKKKKKGRNESIDWIAITFKS